jgi:hypothetical protein
MTLHPQTGSSNIARLVQFFLLALPLIGAEQEIAPLGQIVSPKDGITVQESKYLAPNSIVRARFQFGESIAIIYDLHPRPPDYNPHIAIYENNQIAADFDLKNIDEYAESYVFVDAKQFITPLQETGIAAAFRNAGDGAGSIFVAIAGLKNKWEITFLKRCTQARLTISHDGDILALLSVYDPEDNDCTWCPHRYQKEVYVYNRKAKKYKLSKRMLQPKRMDPTSVLMQVVEIK